MKTNVLTVQQEDGKFVSYDPKRLKGVNVYREVQREIAEGERVQFTTVHKELGVANRDLGTVTKMEPNGTKVRGKNMLVVTRTLRQASPTVLLFLYAGYSFATDDNTPQNIVRHQLQAKIRQ